jgi:hypothetical protein
MKIQRKTEERVLVVSKTEFLIGWAIIIYCVMLSQLAHTGDGALVLFEGVVCYGMLIAVSFWIDRKGTSNDICLYKTYRDSFPSTDIYA